MPIWWSSLANFVLKLVLILSERTCNAVYWNSDEAHVFCSVLPFQQAPMDVSTSKRCQVTDSFVKTAVQTLPKKGKKKWTKTQIYSLTLSSLYETIHMTFPFLKYHLFAAKHASIRSIHFLNVNFKHHLCNVSIDRLGFMDYSGICFQVPAMQFTFQ